MAKATQQKMAGSKGTFAMQMNKPKNNSADNFSSKDAATMMQAALYLDPPTDPPTKKEEQPSEKIPTVTVEKSSSSTNVDGGSSNNSSYSKTPFSSDPEEKAKQKEWIKNNPEKYKELIDAKKNKSSNNVSNESSSSSKNIALSNKSESDILEEQKSVTNTNMSIIEGIDLKAKNQRISDSIAGRNKYTNQMNFQNFKKSNTPGTSEFNFANKVGSAYATAGQSNSGYSSFSESLSKAKDSSGNPMFSSPSDFVNTVYSTSDRPGTMKPKMNSRDWPIAKRISGYLGSSWNVNETMKSLREEQSNLQMAPLKFYKKK